MSASTDRYSAIAIALHWLIAALLVGNVFVGGAMDDARGAARAALFVRHETIGIVVLALTIVRLAWRLGHPAPKLPDAMADWEKWLARAVHVLFYALLLAIPLLGWASASAGRGVAPLFGSIPFFDLPVPRDHDLHEAFGEAHELAVKAGYVLVALHVAGALKHHFIARDDVLARMLPFLRRKAR